MQENVELIAKSTMTAASLYTHHSRVMTVLLSLLLLLLWSAGCSEDQEESDDARFEPEDTTTVVPATGPSGAAAPTRPQSMGGKIRIEGDSAEVRFRLVDDAVLPFSTYVPDGIIQGERIAHDGGTGVRFFANFAGKLSKDTYLNIFFPARDTTFELLRKSVAGDSTSLLYQMGMKIDKAGTAAKFCPWAKESFSFSGPSDGKNVKGALCIGTHRGRPFYVLVHYPAENASGFPPRVERILSEIRWDDTGRPLEKE
jgi:hypothetical protein